MHRTKPETPRSLSMASTHTLGTASTRKGISVGICITSMFRELSWAMRRTQGCPASPLGCWEEAHLTFMSLVTFTRGNGPKPCCRFELDHWEVGGCDVNTQSWMVRHTVTKCYTQTILLLKGWGKGTEWNYLIVKKKKKRNKICTKYQTQAKGK